MAKFSPTKSDSVFTSPRQTSAPPRRALGHAMQSFQRPSYRRLQNSPYFCVFKYARAVKQKVWNGAENRRVRLARFARVRLLRRFTDFFTDFEKKKPTVLQSILTEKMA